MRWCWRDICWARRPGGATAGDNVPCELGYAGSALLVLLFSLLLAARLALRASALLHVRMA